LKRFFGEGRKKSRNQNGAKADDHGFRPFFEFQSCPEKNLATSASKSSDAAEEREGAGTGGDAEEAESEAEDEDEADNGHNRR